MLPLYLLLYELIDTLWNVNIDFICYEQFYICELIDTLWNVNLSVHLTYLLSKSELIDTLWNVNSEIHIHTENAFGINRYIMECKSFDDLDTG